MIPLELPEESDPALRKILIWKGEIQGVYERRTRLKIAIYRNHSLPKSQSEMEAWRQEILSQDWEVFQKGTDKILASFKPREVVWEAFSKPKGSKKEPKLFQATIWGDLYATDQKTLSLVGNGSYIAKYKEEAAYVEPHNFFGKPKTPLPKRILHPVDRKEMLLVERGVFLYGQGIDSTESSYHLDYFQPNMGNLKEIAPFYMDKYEVTNSEYALYLQKTNSKPPAHWIGGKFPVGEESHPVNFLTYSEVEGYAKWSGKRIPTEWEWEKAARGVGVEIVENKNETLSYYIQAITYPHGDLYDAKFCNTIESGIGKTQSIYDLPKESASPYGILGMCGNVAEWTSSWYESYPNQPFLQRNYGKIYKVIRGGSYLEDSKVARVFHRSFGGNPNLMQDRKAGFRLVKDL